MNPSKVERLFLKLCKESPEVVFSALNKKELIKPLIYKDHISNGGKLGTRGIANKYGITRSSVKWFLKQNKKQNDTNNSK